MLAVGPLGILILHRREPMTVRGGESRDAPWLSRRMEEWVRRFGASLPMRMTASWFGSLDLPDTRLWRD